MSPFSRSNHLLVPGGITSPSSQGTHPGNKGGEKNTISKSWTPAPRNVAGYSRTEKRNIEAVQQEATFYCARTDSVDSCPKAEPPKQRGLTLYTLESSLQKQEARFNPYMVACNSIGYFTPQCCVTFFTFRFFKF
jgi:hypothetical protein